jgi:mannosyltransferase
MIAMGKKRENRGKKGDAQGSECNLDGDFHTPVRSFRDLSLDNVRISLARSRYVQILLSVSLIGFFLRFYNLGYNSLWLDEASTLTFAVKSLPEIWQATTSGEFNPPLFYWVEHMMLVFGNSEIILRFIPALLGFLTIPLIYLAGREFIDRNVGIIAATAFAFSPFLVYYSQEARAYSMMLFFVTFSMVFYFRALKSNDGKDWALFGILSALAFWSHFYALVIIGALVLYALYELIPKIRSNLSAARPAVTAGILFGIICLPLILVTVQLFALRTASAPTFGIQGPDLIIATFAQISGSEIAMYILFVLFLAGIVQAFLLDKNKGVFIISVTVLAFVISGFLSYRIPMQPRYLIFMSIVYFITISLSYRLLYTRLSSRGIVYGFLALMVIINAPTLIGYYSGYSKEDWRGLSGQIQQLTRPGDQIVLVPGYLYQPFDYYYSNKTHGTIELYADNEKSLESIYSANPNTTIYYVVTGDINSADPTGGAVSWLEKNTKFIANRNGVLLATSG